jgi:DNA-binding NtrC family response regulator
MTKKHKTQKEMPSHQENGSQEDNPALAHLINMLKLLRDECAATSGIQAEGPRLDLRPVFNALRQVEEVNQPQQSSPLVYKREQVLEMTGWSRTTLWRRCKSVGISLGRDVFTPEEIILLVKRRRYSGAF